MGLLILLSPDQPMSSYKEKDVLHQFVAMEADVRTVGKFYFITKVCNQKEIYLCLSLAKTFFFYK